MTRIEYLQEQATRAERLARSGLDRLTVDRLRLYAAECRIELDYLRAREKTAEAPLTSHARHERAASGMHLPASA